MPKRGVFPRDEGSHRSDVTDNIGISNFFLIDHGNSTS